MGKTSREKTIYWSGLLGGVGIGAALVMVKLNNDSAVLITAVTVVIAGIFASYITYNRAK